MRAAVVATVLCFSMAGLSAAAELQAAIRRSTHIQAQGLGPALRALAKEHGFQLVYRAELVRELNTSGAIGELTTEDALTQLLQGTGLTHRRLDETTITIVPIAAQTSAAAGQDSGLAEPSRDEVEEILVTGTHIRGIQFSASPVLKFGRVQLERSGFSTLDQFIESLPQNFGGGASQDTVGTDSSVGNDAYGNAVNLRALGPGASLVLLNGRRVAPGGNGGRFVDISMIPMSAVERVEVLTDGASAIYGADAVGGVVNFILRDDYEGAETAVRYGSVTEGALSELQASQSLGANWEGGATLISYEYHEREALDARDRDFTASAEVPRTLLPEQKRHSVYANVHQDLGSRWSLFADALYARRETENHLAYLSLINDEQSQGEQLFASFGGRARLGGNWSLQLTSSYSDYQFDASYLRTPVDTDEGELRRTRVDNDVWSFDALTDGTVLLLPGGDLRLAVGAAHRRENVRPTTGGTIPNREVTAVFGELFIPLLGKPNAIIGAQALELSVAARYEEYSDFGDDVTPKLGLRWQPVAGLSVRATYGESFKAPALTDLAQGTESLLAFIASDFGVDVPGDPLILLRTQAQRPELREERSSSWTAGVDFAPASGAISLNVTYFEIEFEDRIASPVSGGFQAFFTQPAFSRYVLASPDAAFVNARLNEATDFTDLTGGMFTPEDVALWADATVTNIAEEMQSGIDFTARYPFEVGVERFEAVLNSTYLTQFEKRAVAGAPPREALNTLNEPIDLRARAGLLWDHAGLGAALYINYADSYRNTDAERTRIDSWLTLDAQLHYNIVRTAGGPFAGTRLVLSVQNLLDEDPPFVLSQGSPIAHPGYDSVNASPLGRFVALELKKAW
jgi:iron complex outermembrane recepter protein